MQKNNIMQANCKLFAVQLLCNMMIVEFSGSQLVELQSLTGKSLYDAKYNIAKSVTS